MADGKAAQELQKREARLGMQPIAAGDVGRAGWAKTHGGCPAMNASAKQSLVVPEQGQKRARSNGDRRASAGSDENAARLKGDVRGEQATGVCRGGESPAAGSALTDVGEVWKY